MTSQFLENFSLSGPDKIERTGITPSVEKIERSKKPGEQDRETFKETLKREFEKQRQEQDRKKR